MSQIIRTPFDDHEIGQGFNVDSRERVGTALTVASVSEDSNVDGVIVRTSFQSVTTQESLMEALGISVSVDARYGLFSGDAKLNFAQSHAVNSFSSFVAGRCEVHNATRHGHGFAVAEEAKPLLSDPKQFRASFGDMFVRSLKTGGEFYVVARVTSASQEHQSKVAASLQAEYNGLVAGVNFKTAFETAIRETRGQTDVTVFMSQSGGIGSQASFTGPDAAKILDRLSQFPQFVREHPVGYEAELATYDTIPIPIPTPEEIQDRDIVLMDSLTQKMRFLKALSDLQFAQGPDGGVFFEDLPSAADLGIMDTEYRQALNGLFAHAIRVATGKMNPPQMFVANPKPRPVVFKKRAIAPSLTGAWEMSFAGGESKWTFSPRTGNQFDGVEEGLGNARGVAVLTGNHAQLDWASSNPGDQTTGRYLMEFNDAFTFATATCEFFTVLTDLGLVPCRFTRVS
jgi:hypothetical protein